MSCPDEYRFVAAAFVERWVMKPIHSFAMQSEPLKRQTMIIETIINLKIMVSKEVSRCKAICEVLWMMRSQIHASTSLVATKEVSRCEIICQVLWMNSGTHTPNSLIATSPLLSTTARATIPEIYDRRPEKRSCRKCIRDVPQYEATRFVTP